MQAVTVKAMFTMVLLPQSRMSLCWSKPTEFGCRAMANKTSGTDIDAAGEHYRPGLGLRQSDETVEALLFTCLLEMHAVRSVDGSGGL